MASLWTSASGTILLPWKGLFPHRMWSVCGVYPSDSGFKVLKCSLHQKDPAWQPQSCFSQVSQSPDLPKVLCQMWVAVMGSPEAEEVLAPRTGEYLLHTQAGDPLLGSVSAMGVGLSGRPGSLGSLCHQPVSSTRLSSSHQRGLAVTAVRRQREQASKTWPPLTAGGSQSNSNERSHLQ